MECEVTREAVRPQKIRILLVIDEATVGGGQQHVLDIATHLDRSRFVAAVACAGSGFLVDRLKGYNIPCFPLVMNNRPSFSAIRRCAAIIRGVEAEIVHTHGGTAGFAGRIAARMTGARSVHTYHGLHYLHQGGLKKFVFVAVDRALARITNRFICVAQHDYHLGLVAGVVDAGKTVVIRNGIDVRAFAQRKRRDAKQHTSRVVIGTVGRLHTQKGQEYLIEAVSVLRRQDRDVCVRIIGEGDRRAFLHATAERLGIAEYVELPGVSETIAGELARMDIFALPSLWEGLPLALLEAMAAGIPVVSSNVDGILEVVEDNVNGFIVPPRDVKSLALTLGRLCDDPGLRERLSSAALKTVRERFDIARMMKSIEDVYTDIAP